MRIRRDTVGTQYEVLRVSDFKRGDQSFSVE
jgi:hypothetical protein